MIKERDLDPTAVIIWIRSGLTVSGVELSS